MTAACGPNRRISSRITSYNVCYTKLLRIRLTGQEQRPEPLAVRADDLDEVRPDEGQRHRHLQRAKEFGQRLGQGDLVV